MSPGQERTDDMSRLQVKNPSQADAAVEQLYRNMEQRIAASPPGLCPVDLALNFLNLCRAQTCGKCVPCRIGLTQLANMLQEVLEGEPDPHILHHIEVTAEVIVNTADCAIGIDAANMVLVGLKGFPCPAWPSAPRGWTSPATSPW